MTTIILQVFEFVALCLGLILVYITYRGGKLTGQRYLFQLSLGFAIISLSSIVEEVLTYTVHDFSLRQRHFSESIFVNLGLFVILLSLKDGPSANKIEVSDNNFNGRMET